MIVTMPFIFGIAVTAALVEHALLRRCYGRYPILGIGLAGLVLNACAWAFAWGGITWLWPATEISDAMGFRIICTLGMELWAGAVALVVGIPSTAMVALAYYLRKLKA